MNSRSLKLRIARAVHKLANPPRISATKLKIGKNVIIEPGVSISCRELILGDGVHIHAGTTIEMGRLVVGDYTEIGPGCIFTGTHKCSIGHNCWFGHGALLNSSGVAILGNNVGVGARSQLWSHIAFGDVAAGCRFWSERPLIVHDDVWFVGQCIVSPIRAKAKSMAMVGSVVTRDMEENHVYGGFPAKDMTDTFGPQFEEVPLAEKLGRMEAHLAKFLGEHRPKQNRIRIVEATEPNRPDISQFNVSERTYTKRLFPEEVAFMRYLLPIRAKFVPNAESDWVGPDLTRP